MENVSRLASWLPMREQAAAMEASESRAGKGVARESVAMPTVIRGRNAAILRNRLSSKVDAERIWLVKYLKTDSRVSACTAFGNSSDRLSRSRIKVSPAAQP